MTERNRKHSWWKRGLITMICAVMLASMAGCGPETEPTPGPTQETNATLTPTQSIIEPTGEFVQQPAVRDYSYMWWRDGFAAGGGNGQLNIQTGYYGLALMPIRGSITKIGAIAEEIPQEAAGAEDNSRIDSLSVVERMNYSIALDGKVKKMVKISPVNSAVGRTAADTAVSRIIESGRYMQRVDIMNLEFLGETSVTGRVEVAAMPQYLSLEFSLWAPERDRRVADLEFSMTLGKEYTRFTQSEDHRVISAAREDGGGLTFVLPAAEGASMTLEESTRTLTFRQEGVMLITKSFTGMSVILIPSLSASLADAQKYDASAGITVTAEQITPKTGRAQKTQFDPKGYWDISLNNMMTWRGPDFREEERQDEMDRLKFTLRNDSDETVKVPIRFQKENRLGVEGCSPFLRDAETGEPIGVQVQLSKNWHEPEGFEATDPAIYYTGIWFHGYTYLEVPAHSDVTYEFCMTYAKWGGVYAASHSQLCLAGWGGNYQQWESSAIGAFGESFCYEAEMTHGRGYITDIRPLLVTSIYGGTYNWTENVGGGNFLVYTKDNTGKMIGFKQVRTQFRKQGPNLTEVIYRGVTTDGKIEYEFMVNLPRTNDISRAYHTFRYTFLQDVTFDRLAFYQFGADNYNDNHWDTMAIGNDAGTVSVSVGGTEYSGEFALPQMSTVGYVGGGGMQRAEVPGDGLWLAFMGYAPVLWKQTPGANRALNLLSYRAELNGKTYEKPSLSLFHTLNGNVSCIAVELGPPAEAGNTIKAGSTVEGTVEWMNFPVSKDDYYGPSGIIQAIPAADFNTSRIVYTYVKGGKYQVSAQKGTVQRRVPITVCCAGTQGVGETAAEITVTGGIGYVPLTFTGVRHYSGYRLEEEVGGSWQRVDQSTYGNDYWQAWYDANTCTYELTFNVEHSGDPAAQHRYRLVRV